MLVTTRTLGNRRPLLEDFSAPPPADLGDGDRFRLRDVIASVVRAQVDAFHKRQHRMRFDRVLSARTIDAGAARGKVDPAPKPEPQSVNVDDSVAAALLAFEDGLYLVIVDEVERRTLDEYVQITPDSRLTFIRLTFLAGG